MTLDPVSYVCTAHSADLTAIVAALLAGATAATVLLTASASLAGAIV
jgi:hypothetical protein